MWGYWHIRRSGVAQHTVDAALGSCKLGIQNSQKFCEPAQSGQTEDVDFQPEAVFSFVSRTASFEAKPCKSSKFLQDRPQDEIGLAQDIGIGHRSRITEESNPRFRISNFEVQDWFKFTIY